MKRFVLIFCTKIFGWVSQDPLRFDLCSKNSGWVSEASLKNGRAFGVLTRLDGKLHVLGGDDGSYDGHDGADVND